MSNSMFYCGIDKNDSNRSLVSMLEKYAETSASQIYIIRAPLGTGEEHYEYKDAAAILIPKHKILLVNFFDECEEFQNYCDDFIEDLGFLSEKFDYKIQLGRPRTWKAQLINRINLSSFNTIEDLLSLGFLENVVEQRNADFLISLLIGSINDIARVGGEYPETLLDQVKKKIVLFDGDQSRFIYSYSAVRQRITIQGLAGTGKTELLLHKLKDLYVNDKDCKIVFTCFNKILAHSMKKRVPEFFNFMRVEEQIKWDERLWVMSSWGSRGNKNSGIYAYICSKYELEFYPFSYNHSFDTVCKMALEELDKKENIESCFDYILIDESQDFPESFFKLCEKVTKNTVYVAGDIFQDIYDRNINQSVQSDFLLNKCYRTDPRTLMFAHAVGMGLYETPVIRWLDDKEWQACGYIVDRKSDTFTLSRVPLRRFEDVDMSDTKSIQVMECSGEAMESKIYSIIDDIRTNNPTVQAGDIAIVFEGNSPANYDLADALAIRIPKKYNWRAIKGYEVKTNTSDAVFISNKNNIKGLEFPFVICVARGRITDNVFSRNTLYMMLTRSFITSYLLVNNYSVSDSIMGKRFNEDFIDIYSRAAESICENGIMLLREPPENEKKQQNQKVSIAVSKQRSIKDLIEEVFLEYPQLSVKSRKTITKTMIEFVGAEDSMTEEEIQERTRKMIPAFI